MRTCANAVVALSLACAVASVHSQVTWPEWSPRPVPGASLSPVAAQLPADVSVSLPGPMVSPTRAKWSGLWGGWACRDAVCDTRLAVEKVDNEGASIVYVFGSASVRSNPQRVEAKFVGDELHGTLASGSRVAYRFREDGSIDFLFLSRTGNPIGGVLSKQK